MEAARRRTAWLMVILVRDFAERRDERLGLSRGVQEERTDGSGDWGGVDPSSAGELTSWRRTVVLAHQEPPIQRLAPDV